MVYRIVNETDTTSYLLRMSLLGCPTWAPMPTGDDGLFRRHEFATFARRDAAVRHARKLCDYPRRSDVRIVKEAQ